MEEGTENLSFLIMVPLTGARVLLVLAALFWLGTPGYQLRIVLYAWTKLRNLHLQTDFQVSN